MEIDYSKCDRELSRMIKKNINSLGLEQIRSVKSKGKCNRCVYVGVNDRELEEALYPCPGRTSLTKNKSIKFNSHNKCLQHWEWFAHMYEMKIKESNKEW